MTRAVINGHNPKHLLQLSSLEFMGDVTGESLFVMAALKINDSPGDLFSYCRYILITYC